MIACFLIGRFLLVRRGDRAGAARVCSLRPSATLATSAESLAVPVVVWFETTKVVLVKEYSGSPLGRVRQESLLAVLAFDQTCDKRLALGKPCNPDYMRAWLVPRRHRLHLLPGVRNSVLVDAQGAAAAQRSADQYETSFHSPRSCPSEAARAVSQFVASAKSASAGPSYFLLMRARKGLPSHKRVWRLADHAAVFKACQNNL